MLGDKISAQTKLNVLNAIETRVIKPMDLHFAGDKTLLGKHYWRDTLDNWNLVCWGGVAQIALNVISDQNKRDKYISEAFKNSQYSWNSWETDGFNNEGMNKLFCFQLRVFRLLKQ